MKRNIVLKGNFKNINEIISKFPNLEVSDQVNEHTEVFILADKPTWFMATSDIGLCFTEATRLEVKCLRENLQEMA